MQIVFTGLYPPNIMYCSVVTYRETIILGLSHVPKSFVKVLLNMNSFSYQAQY